MKIIAGLTGPTGAGKSTVSAVAGDLGVNVIDCDKAARLAVEKGTEGLKALVAAFGDDILNTDGTLNRARLAEKAFCDSKHTELLNNTILPHIAKIIKNMIISDKTLLDAPTLFESGLSNICNKTIAVLADENIRMERIMNRDNIEKNSALMRIKAGKPDSFYIEKADYTVYNNGEVEHTKQEIKQIFKEIFERN